MRKFIRDLKAVVALNPGVRALLPMLWKRMKRAYAWILLNELFLIALLVPTKFFFDGMHQRTPVFWLIWLAIAVGVAALLETCIATKMDDHRYSFQLELKLLLWGEGHAKQLQMPWLWHVENGAGRKLTDFIETVNFVDDLMVSVLFNLSSLIPRILLTVAVMPYLGWYYTLLAAASVGAYAAILYLSRKSIGKMNDEYHDDCKRLTEAGAELINSAHTIKILAQENEFATANSETIQWFNDRERVRHSLWNWTIIRYRFLPAISKTCLLLFLCWQIAVVKQEEVGSLIGAFVLALSWMERKYSNLGQLTDFQNKLRRGIPALQELIRIFLLQPDVREVEMPIEHTIQGNIEFRNVTFRYPGAKRDALQNVSFVIGAGETVALVGRSGSGKSTTGFLIQRMFDSNSGSIHIDGINIRDLSLTPLRRSVGKVDQQLRVFNKSIKDNIRISWEDAPAGRELWAAQQAQALGFINELPLGFNTIVGENGANLSGGQLQRLVIARVLHSNAPIIIFDEATSALDVETERALQSAMDAFAHNRTTIIIAHRLSTIEQADKIIVFNDDGTVAEIGSPAELLVDPTSTYRRFRDLQLGGVTEEAAKSRHAVAVV